MEVEEYSGFLDYISKGPVKDGYFLIFYTVFGCKEFGAGIRNSEFGSKFHCLGCPLN
jgi:hypothetical protein